MGKPKGLRDVYSSGCGAAEEILGFPKIGKNLFIAGFAVVVVVILVIVGTMAWGVGSGNIDVNELAKSGAEIAKSIK